MPERASSSDDARDVGRSSPIPHLRRHEKALADVGGPTGPPQRVKLRNRCRGAMDSQEILALALHLASMARMIGIGLMCIHNPCDEIGRRLMEEALRAQLPEKPRVRDAVAVLESMPEFRSALTRIVVRMGTTDHPLGKWAVHHGAGTNGGVPVARAAFDHGIDTVFYIHIDAGALRRLCQ